MTQDEIKINEVIKECKSRTRGGSCSTCDCNKKECLLNLLELYNYYFSGNPISFRRN
jgi:hypothetical protein